MHGGNNGLIEYLKSKQLIIGSGYGDFKDQHIRIANFPAHSKESIEMLVDEMVNTLRGNEQNYRSLIFAL